MKLRDSIPRCSLMLLACIGLVGGGLLAQDVTASRVSWRPPAVPLVVHDPYFSIWSRADRLHDTWPTHWTGRTQALQSMIRIDGKAARLLGDLPRDVPPLEQKSLEVTPTRTIYTFGDGTVQVTLEFLTPALPDDLELLALPITHLTWEVRALDGQAHEVDLYFDCSAELCVDSADQPVTWDRVPHAELEVVKVGTAAQPVLQKKGDDLRIDWGYAHVAVPRNGGGRVVVARDEVARGGFARGETHPSADDLEKPRPARDRWPVLAAVLPVGKVGADPVSRRVFLGYDDLESIQYMETRLVGYWRRSGRTLLQGFEGAHRDHRVLRDRAIAFDRELTGDLRAAGGDTYARIATLAYRQCLAGNKLVADKNGRPLLFPKENFSNGCIATVDVIYPMAPLFLLLGSDLARSMLVPVLDYGASTRWRFPFAPHDLGTYPHATGQVYGGGEKTEENQMPVEESGNLILLVAAIARAEGNADFAALYWGILERWAQYLEEKGLDPENQLCTDDFAGHLAHNVNLSAKAILALGAWGGLCELRGLGEQAARVRKKAREFAARWVQMADDGDHTRLAFDRPGTWSQKYNLVWDDLLGLGLFSQEIKRREIAYYLKVQNAFGLPLDSRKDYTKLDWITWSASLATDRRDFERLVTPVARFLSESPDRVPMSDWYGTKDARVVGFVARPVVGGVFLRLLGDSATWKRWFDRGARGKEPWAPLPIGQK